MSRLTTHRRPLRSARRRSRYFQYLETLEQKCLLSFTIAVLPDAQYMNEGTSQFAAETAWVEGQKTAQNIQFTVDLGDIVDHGNQYAADWADAVTGMNNIKAMGLPFG